MRVDPQILRRIGFYILGNRRLCLSEEVNSIPEAMGILEKTLDGELKEKDIEIVRDGALKGIPLTLNKNCPPLDSIRDYIKEKIRETPGSFTSCKHEVYFNPFKRNSPKTHYIEITHGIIPEKAEEPRIPYEGIFFQFKTRR